MKTDTTAPPQKLNAHSFDGSCAPHIGGNWAQQIGFSLGIFQWIQTADGKGLKKSAVKIRVKGYVSNAAIVFDKARELCKRLDAGETFKQKSLSC